MVGERDRGGRIVAVECRQSSPGSEHAERLAHRPLRFGDVTQGGVEDDHVEPSVVERE
jgi:hypothetical protein